MTTDLTPGTTRAPIEVLGMVSTSYGSESAGWRSGPVVDDTNLEAVSSLADNWLHVQNETACGKRKRSLLIVKSRGMEHYNDPIDFTISNDGIALAHAPSLSVSNSTNGK